MKKEEIKELAKNGKKHKDAWRGGEFKSAKHQALRLKKKEEKEEK